MPFPGFLAKVGECTAEALEPAAAKAFIDANPDTLLLDVQDPGSDMIPGSYNASLGTLFFKASTDLADFTDAKITGRAADAPVRIIRTRTGRNTHPRGIMQVPSHPLTLKHLFGTSRSIARLLSTAASAARPSSAPRSLWTVSRRGITLSPSSTLAISSAGLASLVIRSHISCSRARVPLHGLCFVLYRWIHQREDHRGWLRRLEEGRPLNDATEPRRAISARDRRDGASKGEGCPDTPPLPRFRARPCRACAQHERAAASRRDSTAFLGRKRSTCDVNAM